jgi:hypothetical protein
MWTNKALTIREALVLMAVLWAVGGCLLVAAWRSGAAERKASSAPTCTEAQAFTPAECRVTLEGTMTRLTHDRADIDVAGRHITATVSLAGTVEDVPGVAVQVTMYRGKAIHVQGPHLNFDTADAPATTRSDLQGFATAFFLGGALLAAGNVLLGAVQGRPRATT